MNFVYMIGNTAMALVVVVFVFFIYNQQNKEEESINNERSEQFEGVTDEFLRKKKFNIVEKKLSIQTINNERKQDNQFLSRNEIKTDTDKSSLNKKDKSSLNKYYTAKEIRDRSVDIKPISLYNEDGYIIDKNDWRYICKEFGEISQTEVKNVLKEFDRRLKPTNFVGHNYIIHEEVLEDNYFIKQTSSKERMKYIHKEFSSNHSLKTKLIEGHTIYNIYLMIRRVLMVTILKDDEWYSFFSQNEIKSLFRNSRLFFEHLDDKNRLFKNTENGKIFVKIIIYTYFITIYEIMNCLYMNLDIFVKYENQFVVSDLEIQTVLRNILNCFYSHNLFTMSFVHDFNHPISFKDLNSDVMDWNKALKAVPIEVERRLMNIKKTVPCLDFMNRIALTSERDILLPLNFVDRIINSFLYSIQSKKNKILKK